MPNPLFNLLGGNNSLNPMANVINQFMQFKQSFRGNPQQQVQNLLNSGRMTQQQFNQLQAMATQFQKLLNM